MATLKTPPSAQDHSSGPENAPVTLVEYVDLQCPDCLNAKPIVDDICAQMDGELRFVWRHFPMVTSHPMAQLASEAAEAAGEQGKFWEMVDLLFENQRGLDEDTLRRLARLLNLDVPRFQKALEEHKFEERVRSDFSDGVRSGVNGTPTFFINGQRFDGDWSKPGELINALRDAAPA